MATNYTLTLYTNGSGGLSKNPSFSTYPSGVTVTLTATPNAGWYFANWTGDTNSTVNPLNVTINSNMVVTGNFLAYPTYSVTLTTNGQGSIGLSPSGGSYLSNTVVTAAATPAGGWVFVAWLGATNTSANPVTVAVNTNITLQALFAQLPSFDVQPTSVTNQPGSTVNFTSHSVGTAPLGYNWYFSGGTLTNAVNGTLSLTNVTSAQAGNYWAVATNKYGSATSSVVSLTLTNPIGPTNVVTSPDQGSLQAAIALGGWVGIGFSGTVTLTNTIIITNNVVLDGTGVAATISGGNAVRLFYVTNGASLTISNLTLANGSYIVTSGAGYGAAIYNNYGTLALVSVTLTNNSAQATGGGAAGGGAIFNNGGSAFLYSCSLSNNVAIAGGSTATSVTAPSALGGAFYNNNGTATIKECTISSNLCEGLSYYNSYLNLGTGLSKGGAIYQSSGTLSVIGAIFITNNSTGGNGVGLPSVPGSPAYGGALAADGGVVVISQSRFVSNVARAGDAGYHSQAAIAYGGAIASGSTLSVIDSFFYANQAFTGAGTFNGGNNGFKGPDGLGGAIYNSGQTMLNRCSVYSNYVQGGSVAPYPGSYANGGNGLGGGIFNASQLTVTNSTIALNSAAGNVGYGNMTSVDGTNGFGMGGGLFNGNGATFVGVNITIASNSCVSPPPDGPLSVSGTGTGLQIANTNGTLRIHNTLIAGTNSNAYGPITDDGYNICSDGSAALFGGSSYNYTDPQLAPLGNYGGPTLCMALMSASPAIDNGDSNGAPNVDQRGYPRPFGNGVDMGAYEFGASLFNAPTVAISAGSTNVQLSFTANPSNTYYLQYSTNLISWAMLSTNGPVSSQTNINQSISKQAYSRCYFRLLIQ